MAVGLADDIGVTVVAVIISVIATRFSISFFIEALNPRFRSVTAERTASLDTPS